MTVTVNDYILKRRQHHESTQSHKIVRNVLHSHRSIFKSSSFTESGLYTPAEVRNAVSYLRLTDDPVQVTKSHKLCLRLCLTETTTSSSQLAQAKGLWTSLRTQADDTKSLDQMFGACDLEKKCFPLKGRDWVAAVAGFCNRSKINLSIKWLETQQNIWGWSKATRIAEGVQQRSGKLLQNSLFRVVCQSTRNMQR